MLMIPVMMRIMSLSTHFCSTYRGNTMFGPIAVGQYLISSYLGPLTCMFGHLNYLLTELLAPQIAGANGDICSSYEVRGQVWPP